MSVLGFVLTLHSGVAIIAIPLKSRDAEMLANVVV